jgi:hypothetical protein
MKVTKQRLKQIILEEVEHLLTENTDLKTVSITLAKIRERYKNNQNADVKDIMTDLYSLEHKIALEIAPPKYMKKKRRGS